MEKQTIDILLDTNAVLYFLKGQSLIREIIEKADSIALSFISVIELLSYDCSPKEKKAIDSFLKYLDVHYPDVITTQIVIDIRKQTNLKIPDAIIIAQAIQCKKKLVTFDKEIINKCPDAVLSTDF